MEWVVPYKFTCLENFPLIAIRAYEVKGYKRDTYVGQISPAIRQHPDWFEKGSVVVASDFNSNTRWDKERREWNQSTMVAGLRAHGLTNVYRMCRNEAHGEEGSPTFYLQKNRETAFHIDYIFAADRPSPRPGRRRTALANP
jgi:hypothetical protein